MTCGAGRGPHAFSPATFDKVRRRQRNGLTARLGAPATLGLRQTLQFARCVAAGIRAIAQRIGNSKTAHDRQLGSVGLELREQGLEC